MTISGPRVRDFTDRERSLQVVVESDPVYETLMSMFVFHGEGDRSEYEVAQAVVDAVEKYGDDSLVADLDAMGGCGELGLSLVGIAHDMPAPRTVDGLIARLAEVGSVDLRTLLMRNSGIKDSRGHDEATINRAAKGDVEAVRELFADRSHGSKMAALLEREPEQMLADVISIVRRFGEATADVVARHQSVRDRDAVNTRAMAKTIRPDRLVEKVTNGITFEMQPQVSGVLLIPSVVIRPWVVIAEHYTLRIFAYSVSDEVLSADEDAPPAFLVDTFKALGDEKRLRLLGVLASGDLGLKELAQRADIAKSTAHHHLRVLRSAGLVRVVVGEDDKRYGLRRDSIPEAGRLLESFLSERPPTAQIEED